jgi:isopenicillin N synthase-like dioxygenase
MAAMGSVVPIVDLARFRTGAAADRIAVARAFGQALEQTGFVAVTGHGVPESLIESTYEVVKSFFALAVEEKKASELPHRIKDCGYLPVGIESVAATLGDTKPPDLCEALVFKSLLREERAGSGLPGLGACNIWPARPARLAGQVRTYFSAVAGLATTLYRLSALALDLPEDFFAPYLADPSLTLRFVNYPDQPEAPPPGQLRYGAHHDYSGLTIVRQDEAPGGLEFCDRDGSWQPVPPVPGSFVINIGELLARWTNDRWRATLHRVVNPPRALTGSTQRLSLVLFTGPGSESEIACLPTCQGTANPPRYAPVTAGAFIRAKLDSSMIESV